MKFSLLFFMLLIGTFVFAQINQVDSKGRKQGPWEKVYEGTRVLQYKGQFKDDKPVGKFTYFYKSSKVKAVIKHDENSNRSSAYYYHENGAFMSHGIFRDQKKDSVWVNFGPSQRLSSTETYKNGELNGKKIVYYVPEDLNNKNQIPSAVYNYVDGKLDGKFTEYFESLIVMGDGFYDMNTRVGIWNRYHPNGKKMSMTRYKDGVRHGWCSAYSTTGAEIAKNYYYYGQHLTGKRLEKKMSEMKRLGLNPNE